MTFLNFFLHSKEKMLLCEATGIDLVIENLYFPSNILNLAWITSPIRINSLTVISDQELIVNEYTLKSITNNLFTDMRSLHLSNILFQYTNNSHFFERFADIIEKLSFQSISNVKFPKILNEIPLRTLKSLDLSNNNFKTELNEYFFTEMYQIQRIVLKQCMIEQFDPNTFTNVLGSIELIDLNENRLKRLPEGFAAALNLDSRLLTIKLSQNPWECSCDEYSSTFKYIKCLEKCTQATDRSDNRKMIVHPTKNKSYQARSVQDSNTIELQCEDLNDSEKTETVSVKRPTHNIQITMQDDKKLIVNAYGPKDGYLLWFNDSLALSMKDDAMISKYIQCSDLSTLELDNVTPGATYIFCVISPNGNDQISPFNCVAYYVNTKVDIDVDTNEVWISEDQKVSAIGLASGLLFVFIWLGAMFGTCMIRKYPNWLDGGKDVIIVDNSNRFDKRSSCAISSAYSIDDNNAIDYG